MKLFSSSLKTLLVSALAAGLSLGTGLAASEATGPSPDQLFVRKATQGGMTEIKMGELATKQAESPELKEFGAMMVTHHSQMSAELKTAAEKKGLTFPSALNANHQAMVDALAKLSGAKFDKAFVVAMVKNHEQDAALFTKASETLPDPDIKGVATAGVPIIQSHLQKIKEIQAKMK